MFLENVERNQEFDAHKNIITLYSPKHNLKGYISIHRANSRIPSFGATRIAKYENDNNALSDSLRLSKLMSYKSAMAELPYGGAKAVLTSIDRSKEAFKEYGKIVDSLRGLFVTGADVGVSIDDVKQMRKTSQFIVGTTSDPVRFTVEGVILALEESIKYRKLSKENLTFAVQGVGATGSGILEKILQYASKIYISDIDNKKLEKYRKYANVEIVDTESIFTKDVDVFMPCAMAHAINMKTIKDIKTKIVLGPANNQLQDSKLADILKDKGVLYAPDYLVNAGGLIAVADEYEHSNHRIKRVQYKLKVIKKNINKIYSKSERYNKSTANIADAIAESRFNDID